MTYFLHLIGPNLYNIDRSKQYDISSFKGHQILDVPDRIKHPKIKSAKVNSFEISNFTVYAQFLNFVNLEGTRY